MKVAAMQPYFFPYLGYYSLIKMSDKFILGDNVQFIRRGWMERNRILKPSSGEGWLYIAVPMVKKPLSTLICEMEIRNNEDWKGKLFRQLMHYKKSAPFYRETIQVIEDSLSIDTNSIVKLNENILKKTCEYFEIPFDISVLSEMNLIVEEATHPGEWGLNVTKALGGKEYINPTGGIDIYDREQYADAGITIHFLGNNLSPYDQRRGVFEAGLSIIDVMMFNDPAAIRKLIDDVFYL